MYVAVLAIHSLTRWLVIILLLYSIYRAYKGWFTNLEFTKFENITKTVTVSIVHLQFIIGLWLYFISPIIQYFFHYFKEAVHVNQVRFFGMEHSLLMLVAVIVLTIGSSLSKGKSKSRDKFKTMAIWFTIGLLIILVAIPWPFSPFAGRPWFRAF